MKKLAITVIGVFVLGLFLGFLASKLGITRETIKEEEYSWTRAICNQENECIDVIVSCRNGKVAGIEPILYKVKHAENWTDFRDLEEGFCE